MSSQILMQNSTSKMDFLTDIIENRDNLYHDLSPISELINKSEILKLENKPELAHAIISHNSEFIVENESKTYTLSDSVSIMCPTKKNTKIYFEDRKAFTSHMWVSINVNDIENFLNNLSYLKNMIKIDDIAEILIKSVISIDNTKIPSLAIESRKLTKEILKSRDDFNLKLSLLYNTHLIEQELLYSLIKNNLINDVNKLTVSNKYTSSEQISINRVCEYVKDNIQDNITIDKLYNICSMSRTKFF